MNERTSLQQEAQKIIKTLNFKLTEVIKDDYQTGTIVLKGQVNERQCLFKMVSTHLAGKAAGLRKEAAVSNILEGVKPSLSASPISTTRVLSSGQSNGFVWILREYKVGEALAHFRKSEPLFGYDILNVLFEHDFKKIIDQIIDQIEILISEVSLVQKGAEIFQKRFKESLSEYKIADIEQGIGCSLAKQLDFFKSKERDYFAAKHMQACLGDLVPANIIINKDGQVILTDFEWFCLDNEMMDVALLWMFLWRYPRWQKYLMGEVIVSDQKKVFFRMSVIRQIIGWYNSTFDLQREADDELVSKRHFYRNHQWTKYLLAAGESLDFLIKTSKAINK